MAFRFVNISGNPNGSSKPIFLGNIFGTPPKKDVKLPVLNVDAIRKNYINKEYKSAKDKYEEIMKLMVSSPELFNLYSFINVNNKNYVAWRWGEPHKIAEIDDIHPINVITNDGEKYTESTMTESNWIQFSEQADDPKDHNSNMDPKSEVD